MDIDEHQLTPLSPTTPALTLANAFCECIKADDDEAEEVRVVLLCAGTDLAQTAGCGRWAEFGVGGCLDRFAWDDDERRATILPSSTTAKSGKRAICKFGVTADCFFEAIASSPTKPGAKQPCRPAVGQRRGNRYVDPGFSLSTCAAAVSAVRDPLRPLLMSCVREGCGIKNCLYALE